MCVSALRVRQIGELKLRGSRLLLCSHASPETGAVMRSRDKHTVPAEEAAAALPYGLHVQSLSHYHSQNKHVLYVNDLS